MYASGVLLTDKSIAVAYYYIYIYLYIYIYIYIALLTCIGTPALLPPWGVMCYSVCLTIRCTCTHLYIPTPSAYFPPLLAISRTCNCMYSFSLPGRSCNLRVPHRAFYHPFACSITAPTGFNKIPGYKKKKVATPPNPEEPGSSGRVYASRSCPWYFNSYHWRQQQQWHRLQLYPCPTSFG